MNTAITKTRGRARHPRRGAMGGAWLLAVALCAATGACDQASAATEAPPVNAAAVAPSAPQTRQAGPPTDLTAPTAEEARFSGTVTEHLPAGGYHYLRIETDEGPTRWVVTMGGTAKAGSRVDVTSMGSRRDFYSRRLDRRFDEVAFATVKVAD